ncbi:MAG: hypothetical protein R2772_05235 [Chitinophagales bacterium]
MNENSEKTTIESISDLIEKNDRFLDKELSALNDSLPVPNAYTII